MKTHEELLLTMADVTGVLYPNEVIADAIAQFAEPNRVCRQLVNIDRSLQNQPGVTILIPKSVALSASVVDEGASLTLQTQSYDSVAITVQIWGAAVSIGDETIEASKFNLIQDAMQNLGKALADAEDKDIINELIDYTTAADVDLVTTGSVTTVALAYSNIIVVDSIVVTLTTTWTETIRMDYKHGVVGFSTAPSSATINFGYNASVPTIETTTAGVLNAWTINEARSTVVAAGYKPDVIIMHPNQYMDILNDSQFTDAAKYGSTRPIQNGEVGMIYGLKVFVTTQMYDGVAVVFDSTKAITYAIKREIYTKMTREGSYAVMGVAALMAKMWAKCGRVWDSSICMITNMQSDASLDVAAD